MSGCRNRMEAAISRSGKAMKTKYFHDHDRMAGILSGLLLIWLIPWCVGGENPAADFAKEIVPILELNCVECHRDGKDEGGLRMDTRDGLLRGGDGGAGVVAGKPDEGLIMERVTLPADDSDIMPPKGDPLTSREIEALKRWISAGAAWPEDRVLIARNRADDQPPAPLPAGGPPIREVVVYPPAIQLDHQNDRQSVVVMARYQNDTTQDLTAHTEFALANPALAERRKHTFHPLQDGETQLVAKVAGFEVKVPVAVKGAKVRPPVRFELDVLPVLMRENCNTGDCHGSARGKDGFMLSLFGYDPKGDYYRITREMNGRRINLAIPEESLLVEKSIEAVPHTGGKLFESGSESWQTMVDWLRAGAPEDPADLPKVVDLEVYPQQLVLEGEGVSHQLTVRAKYSDGTDRDVTNRAVYVTNNEPVAAAGEDGLVKAGSRGEAFVMARYETFTKGTQVIVIPKGLKYERPRLPENNYVDKLVHEKLHKLRIIPAEVCTDEEFLRRAYIDIVGQVPAPEEYAAFTQDKNPEKRDALVDRLLVRKEFTEMWVMKWAELLQIRSTDNVAQGLSYKAALLYFNWLQDRIAGKVPMDQIVRELLGSTGGTFANPPTNYYNTERDLLKVSENVAQVFMGFRLQCAQCHNHPFDRWTMEDYYGWAAFFSQIGRKRAEDPREEVIFNRGSGETKHPVDNRNIAPRFLGGAVASAPGKDRREVMAGWLTSPDNPYFSKNIANLVWAHFFGIGIVEPVDDVRVSNPASNPELMDALAAKLVEYDYDFRRLVRDICTSRTYQLSVRSNDTNRDDLKNFSKARVRRMRAEVLLDVITQVTETQNKFKGLPLGARAVQVADGTTSSYFLQTFGRATRETVCSCEVRMEPSLSQALHLINGETVTRKIAEGGLVKTAIAAGQSNEQIVTGLYIRCVSRQPSKEEMAKILGQLQPAEGKADVRQQVLEDLFWALLNSKEFMFNH